MRRTLNTGSVTRLTARLFHRSSENPTLVNNPRTCPSLAHCSLFSTLATASSSTRVSCDPVWLQLLLLTLSAFISNNSALHASPHTAHTAHLCPVTTGPDSQHESATAHTAGRSFAQQSPHTPAPAPAGSHSRCGHLTQPPNSSSRGAGCVQVRQLQGRHDTDASFKEPQGWTKPHSGPCASRCGLGR